MARLDDLHTIAFGLTELMVQEDNAHLLEHWQMIFGSVIIPELVKEDPEILDRHPEFKMLADAYSKDEVLARLAPKVETKEVEKVVEKVVEKKVIVEKKVPVPVAGSNVREDPGHDTVESNGKYRRLKDNGVQKLIRKQRDIDSEDRDHVNRWWNANQKLVDQKDLCQQMVDEINARSGKKPIFPLQLAGYISRLADWGRLSADARKSLFDRQLTRKMYTVKPEYSAAFCRAIVANYNAQREDERIRQKDHAEMRAQKSANVVNSGACSKIKVIEEDTAILTPVEPEEVEPVVEEDTEDKVVKLTGTMDANATEEDYLKSSCKYCKGAPEDSNEEEEKPVTASVEADNNIDIIFS